jgi:isocitrate dehydrogenase
MSKIDNPTASVHSFDAKNNPAKIPVTVLPGDGIGPEVVGAAMKVADATGANIAWELAEAGAVSFSKGIVSGVPQATIDTITKTGIVLKGPLETPVGFGGKSANVTLRKLFETYGNVRPIAELPGIATPFTGRGIDFVVVRENVEDLYAGIEHMQTPGVAQGLKIITQKGCEKIARLAFELAKSQGRKTIHCATKANILKQTEGMLKRVFETVAIEYPGITAKHMIVDNCAHQMVIAPEQFDVIVMTNMNGDILSDLAAGLVGGLGVAASANLGDKVAMFEAVHGSAPDIAGLGKANPTAMIQALVMMLRHMGKFDAAERVSNALKKTLQDGTHLTADLAAKGNAVTTSQFTDAVIANLIGASSVNSARQYAPIQMPKVSKSPVTVVPQTRQVIGVDVFVEADDTAANIGARMMAAATESGFKLKMISSRGAQVFPTVGGEIDTVDHWRCRFITTSEIGGVSDRQIMMLVSCIGATDRWMHIEKLQQFDGVDAFTKAQGETDAKPATPALQCAA